MTTKRTNIVRDTDHLHRAQKLTGIKTTRAVVQEALETLIQLRGQTLIRELRGELRWEGDLAALREGRGLAAR
jgi:Arc/MetJ family transcription regulator